MKIAINISKNDYEWIKKWGNGKTHIPVNDALFKYFNDGINIDEKLNNIVLYIQERINISDDELVKYELKGLIKKIQLELGGQDTER